MSAKFWEPVLVHKKAVLISNIISDEDWWDSVEQIPVGKIERIENLLILNLHSSIVAAVLRIYNTTWFRLLYGHVLMLHDVYTKAYYVVPIRPTYHEQKPPPLW